jgi:hypothetical protein
MDVYVTVVAGELVVACVDDPAAPG